MGVILGGTLDIVYHSGNKVTLHGSDLTEDESKAETRDLDEMMVSEGEFIGADEEEGDMGGRCVIVVNVLVDSKGRSHVGASVVGDAKVVEGGNKLTAQYWPDRTT